jgi:DNA helicase-2/ATP-dependent DNA helicase PcrA
MQGVFYELLMDCFIGKDWVFDDFALEMIEVDNHTEIPITSTAEDKSMVGKLIKTTYDKIMNAEFSEGCGDENCVWCNLLK